MKLMIFLAVTSVVVMVIMVTQVVRQEMSKRTLTALARDKATEVSKKEKTITVLKTEVQGMKPKLMSLTQLTEEMKRKKDGLQNEKKTLQESINACNNEKTEAEKTKAEGTENLNKQKSEHEQAKQTAQKTIQDLKQKNLDREKAICALVDTTNAEARKLCGLPDAPQ